MRIPHRDRVRDPSALHTFTPATHTYTCRPCSRTHKATLGLRIPHSIGTVSLDPRGSEGGWKEVNNAKGRGYVNLVWLISLRHAIRSDIYMYVLRAAIRIMSSRRRERVVLPLSLFLAPLSYCAFPSLNSGLFRKQIIIRIPLYIYHRMQFACCSNFIPTFCIFTSFYISI